MYSSDHIVLYLVMNISIYFSPKAVETLLNQGLEHA